MTVCEGKEEEMSVSGITAGGKRPADLAKLLKGRSTEQRKIVYTARDVMLYALAVGAGPDDLEFTFENGKDGSGLKAIPSFGTLPCWAALVTEPHYDIPEPASMMALEYFGLRKHYLHMDHEIVMSKPIDPDGGAFVWSSEITDVYDRGEGKGAAVEEELVIRDGSGDTVCTNRFKTYFFEGGGFGGEPMPKSRVAIPEREPDAACEDHVGPMQHMLYRLTGDTNLIHADPAFAEKYGMEGPIVQGLCSFGFACRMLCGEYIPGEPERMKRMAARMSAVLYPDTPVRLETWNEEAATGSKAAVFRLMNMKTGEAVLDRGVFEWE